MSQDLSESHHPVCSEFTADFREWNDPAIQLTDQQLEQYKKHGFVSGINILAESQISQLRDELAEFLDPQHAGHELWYEYHTNESADPDLVLFHALGAWRIGQAMHDILWSPAFLKPASQLLNDQSVRFWHDQLFCKPANHGGVVAWHQDYSYWTRTTPMQHLTCWIGLDDSTVDNGCLQYIPGSHHWDLLPITGLAGDMDAIRKVLTDDQWEQFNNPVAVELKAGQASFHHPLLIHGSFANRTERPRRAVVLNVFADGTCSDADEPLLNGVPAIPQGQPMQGQFFPLLYEAAAGNA